MPMAPRTALAFAAWVLFSAQVGATGLLDGKSFEGMIGPVEKPDLADELFFEDGHFWSDICTRCGFMPGEYLAEETKDGIAFSGTLESETRGRFAYSGLVRQDGSIRVSIQWERRRWYWTSRREIVFIGDRNRPHDIELEAIHQRVERSDPDQNPACARF
ncbi:hypothetical protein [Aestuariicoccus sp. MJ-SS9]|uniref:hypothetical protein n=1 Tax=Aestuariicoccus sp. MJ-SS9 TaxID=3079855 RepID=UPI002910CDE1|nr:hypothetical protein [Aestuariicoccus sp. MJ-SS9]MDU8912509.1 hypothetical protein [Aestuariicoccus sp. MJ-SS9]